MKTKLSLTIVFLAVLITGLFSINFSTRYAFAQAPNLAAAKSVCKNLGYPDGNTGQGGCLRGYQGAAGGQSESDACPSNAGTSCHEGYDAYKNNVQPNSQAAINWGKARSSCFTESDYNKQKSCAQGYNGFLNDKTKSEACNGAPDKAACERGYNKADDKKEVPNSKKGSTAAKDFCKDKSGNEKDACITGYDGGNCAQLYDGKEETACNEGKAQVDKEKTQVDCDAKLTSVLSWIACPVIDMGVAFTDFVFSEFVEPMLVNVPVSTNPDDGSYVAWTRFRLIANVLLVGTLLAIVYSQARGGGGK